LQPFSFREEVIEVHVTIENPNKIYNFEKTYFLEVPVLKSLASNPSVTRVEGNTKKIPS
jgi:hypothetical protein